MRVWKESISNLLNVLHQNLSDNITLLLGRRGFTILYNYQHIIFDSWKGQEIFLFSEVTGPTLRSIRPPMGTGKGPDAELTKQSFPSTLRLRISGDIPPPHAFTTLRGANLTFTYFTVISRLWLFSEGQD